MRHGGHTRTCWRQLVALCSTLKMYSPLIDALLFRTVVINKLCGLPPSRTRTYTCSLTRKVCSDMQENFAEGASAFKKAMCFCCVFQPKGFRYSHL